MSKRNLPSLLLAMTMLCLLLGGCTVSATGTSPTPTPTPGTFITFDMFLTSVKDATFEVYAHLPAAQVQEVQAFEEMRSYIQQMYAGVQPVSSFVSEGRYVDCITIASQPSVHQLGLTTIDQPPAALVPTESGGGQDPGEARDAPSLLTLGLTDPFGHPIACADGTIPMQRLTLEQLVTFKTLQEFLAKAPDGQELAPPLSDQPRPDSATHRYAVALEPVDNYGGSSWLNLWNPSSKFSISQQWYMGGSESSTQTLEGGWIKYPKKFHTKPVLFIYWTASNYKGSGCYNLECAGFVQINSHWYLGGLWNAYSYPGGSQWGFELQWQFDWIEGNWWLFIRGPGEAEAVGYLPTKVYKGGALATAASAMAVGGETYNPGGGAFGQMGSGEFASQGWQVAAFQNRIFYIHPTKSAGLDWASLNFVSEWSPACYTIDVHHGGEWGSYFFFGGPGGYPC
jgi:hypothetical protein